MSGLLFLAVVGAWLATAVWLTRWLLVRMTIKTRPLRALAALLIFGLLLPLPVADEIIGGFQFRELCQKNAVLRIDAERAKGRKVKVVIEPSNELLTRTAIAIYHSHHSYRDVKTGEEVANLDRYFAKGGWFIRMLGISEGNAPITIGKPSCAPVNWATFRKQFDMEIIN